MKITTQAELDAAPRGEWHDLEKGAFVVREGQKVHAYSGPLVFAYSGSKVNAYSGSKVWASSGSVVFAYSGSLVFARSGSEVWAYSGSKVNAYSGSKVLASSGSVVFAYSGSEVHARSGSEVHARSGSEVYADSGSTVYGWEDGEWVLRGGKVEDTAPKFKVGDRVRFINTRADFTINQTRGEFVTPSLDASCAWYHQDDLELAHVHHFTCECGESREDT